MIDVYSVVEYSLRCCRFLENKSENIFFVSFELEGTHSLICKHRERNCDGTLYPIIIIISIILLAYRWVAGTSLQSYFLSSN